MPELQTHTRLMAISREEFIRMLPVALGPNDRMEIIANSIQLLVDDAIVDIHLEPKPEVAIASLRLPSLQVLINLQAPVSETFMARFDRAFQRGGG